MHSRQVHYVVVRRVAHFGHHTTLVVVLEVETSTLTATTYYCSKEDPCSALLTDTDSASLCAVADYL